MGLGVRLGSTLQRPPLDCSTCSSAWRASIDSYSNHHIDQHHFCRRATCKNNYGPATSVYEWNYPLLQYFGLQPRPWREASWASPWRSPCASSMALQSPADVMLASLASAQYKNGHEYYIGVVSVAEWCTLLQTIRFLAVQGQQCSREESSTPTFRLVPENKSGI